MRVRVKGLRVSGPNHLVRVRVRVRVRSGSGLTLGLNPATLSHECDSVRVRVG